MKSIHITAETLPMAWEQAVLACWEQGEPYQTEYDRPDDPPSRDVTCLIHVTAPFAEPRIHRAFPGGLDDLEKYRAEVVYGAHDHWIDPSVGKWEYTYHERLCEYRVPGGSVYDQLAGVVEKLRTAGHTRRAQAVTWQVWNDMTVDDPACLQRLWFRIDQNTGRLNMNVHMRSNDAFKAAFMNMYAFSELQAELAEQLEVEPGEYIHVVDSFHIYGSYFTEFEGFLETIRQRSPADRVYETAFARELFQEACDALLAESDIPEDRKAMIRRRREQI